MTASPGREVDANLLPGAALGSAQTRAEAQDASGEGLGDLVEALGRGHELGIQGLGQLEGRPDFGDCAPVLFLTEPSAIPSQAVVVWGWPCPISAFVSSGMLDSA